MRTELICVGTELLSGKLNTNIGYIAQKLNSIGVTLDCTTTVPDDIEEMKKIFSEIISRADVIIITGGLGSTFDDLTREAVSKVLKKKLVFNKELLQGIVQHFIERGREMPKGNEVQAYIINGARPLVNNVGTAPGQIIEIPVSPKTPSDKQKPKPKDKSQKGKTKDLFLLPGPLKELHPMFDRTILPYIKQKYEHKITRTKILHVYGLPESKVDELIRPVVETEHKLDKESISFTILAHQSIVDIKVTVSGINELIVDELLGRTKKQIYDILRENIYGEDAQTLESVIGQLLMKSRKTLAIAESCTGGMVANRITNIPGASVYFKQSVVTYSNESKVSMLGVSQETIENQGAVSKETALEMALGVKRLAKSDYGLAITGIAGPTGATPTKPIGIVWFGLISDRIQTAEERKFAGSRIEIKNQAANYALNLVYKMIVGI